MVQKLTNNYPIPALLPSSKQTPALQQKVQKVVFLLDQAKTKNKTYPNFIS